jgi:hypothetical protein
VEVPSLKKTPILDHVPWGQEGIEMGRKRKKKMKRERKKTKKKKKKKKEGKMMIIVMKKEGFDREGE